MKHASATIVSIERLFLSAMEVALNHAREIVLQFGASFAEARIRDIVHDLMLSQYLPA